jgi:hypothetical protein
VRGALTTALHLPSREHLLAWYYPGRASVAIFAGFSLLSGFPLSVVDFETWAWHALPILGGGALGFLLAPLMVSRLMPEDCPTRVTVQGGNVEFWQYGRLLTRVPLDSICSVRVLERGLLMMTCAGAVSIPLPTSDPAEVQVVRDLVLSSVPLVEPGKNGS